MKEFFIALGKRLLLGLKIIFKFALILPIPLFMVYVSYTVDRSGLFQGELAPRQVVELMEQGYDVTGFEQMDERQIVRLYARNVDECPKVIAVGSSRALQFNRELVGEDSFFNMGLTGADVRDCMTGYYLYDKYDKTPEVLIWSIDPWCFHGGDASLDSRSDAELYDEFLQEVLGVDTGYEQPDQIELWKALVEPAYFQGNVDYWRKNHGSTVVTDDEGEEIPFRPVEGDLYDQEGPVKRSDGSVLYEKSFRDHSQEQILADTFPLATTFDAIHMEDFNQLDANRVEAFEAFMDYCRSRGTTVILVLSPWHPWLYDTLLDQTQLEQHTGFFQVENYLRKYAAKNNVPLYGSYDPLNIEGMEEMDFFDGVHCRDVMIRKFFPGVPEALRQLESNTLPDPLAVPVRTTAEERVPW